MADPRVIISGGGTGGHIFPALAIADELCRRYPGAEVLFVGALGRMEMTRVPAAGYRIVGLPIAGLDRRNPVKNLTLPLKVIGSLSQAYRLVGQFGPMAAVGVGGYASAPMLAACRLRGIPYLIQEQNSLAGLTNKVLARGAKRVCVAWPGMERYFDPARIVLTGNPVRTHIPLPAPRRALRDEARRAYGLEGIGDRPVILVTGGSLGAGTLNSATERYLDRWLEAGIGVIWQTGSREAARWQALAEGRPGLWVAPFIDRMDLAYAAADLVVARAGALTLSELCLTGLPALLVPSPNVAEDHQTVNAGSLVAAGAARLIRDDRALVELGTTVLSLAPDRPLLDRMGKAAQGLGRPGATAALVDELEKILP